MFKKLLSNLPFNPSLIEEVPGLLKLLRRQQRLRIFSLCVLLVAFLIQLFVAIFPSQPTLNSSYNDLVRGGFESSTEATEDCQSNNSGFGSILANYKITCEEVSTTTTKTVKSNAYANQLFSLNRIAYAKPEELPVNIDGQIYWWRHLSAWDYLRPSNIKVLVGTNTNNQRFMIEYSSANLVMVNEPSVASGCIYKTCPAEYLSVRNETQSISNANNSVALPGDQLIYTYSATNNSNAPINNFVIQNNISGILTYAKTTNLYGATIKNQVVSWPGQTIKPKQTITESMAAEVDSAIPNTPVSSSDPGYFNSQMSDVYGNLVTVKLPLSFAKFTEQIDNRWLPNISATYSLIFIGLMILVVGIYILRASIYMKELTVIKNELH